MTLRAALCITLLTTLFRAALGQGGPPLITDDPGTPGNKHWEINTAFTKTQLDIGNIYELPHIDLNYGYADNVQFKLEGPLSIFDGPTAHFTTLGYTIWGVKWRFANDSKKGPAVSTYPQVTFIGNRGLARLGAIDPGTDLYLPIEVMKSFGRVSLDADSGPLFRQSAGTEYSGGICGEYDINPTLALLGEVHLITTSGLVQDQFVWNLGFKKDLSEHESILFSAGRSFSRQSGDNPGFLLYVGMQVRL